MLVNQKRFPQGCTGYEKPRQKSKDQMILFLKQQPNNKPYHVCMHTGNHEEDTDFNVACEGTEGENEEK